MGARGFNVCPLCGGGFAQREKLQHSRVDELRGSQATDRLVAPTEAIATVSGPTGSRPSLLIRPRSVRTPTEPSAPLVPLRTRIVGQFQQDEPKSRQPVMDVRCY